MTITRTHVELFIGDDRVVGRFLRLEPGYFEVEVVEPVHGRCWDYSYQSWLGALAFHHGHGPRFLDADGELMPLVEERLRRLLPRWLAEARFFAAHGETILAAQGRITAKVRRQAAAREAMGEAEYLAARQALAAQKAAGLSWAVHDRRLAALEARREAGREADAAGPARVAQHVRDRYGVSLRLPDLQSWLAEVERELARR